METKQTKTNLKIRGYFVVIGSLFYVAPIMHYGFVVGLIFLVWVFTFFSRFKSYY